jgi:DNA repair protein RadD
MPSGDRVFTLRPYQAQALTALESYWAAGGGNPLIAMATATGKSLIIAWLIRDVLQRYPDLRILVLTHVQELLGQNLKHLLALWPDAPVGVNCAALGRRDWGDGFCLRRSNLYFATRVRWAGVIWR